MRCPGSGVALDCIDFLSLPSNLLWIRNLLFDVIITKIQFSKKKNWREIVIFPNLPVQTCVKGITCFV